MFEECDVMLELAGLPTDPPIKRDICDKCG